MARILVAAHNPERAIGATRQVLDLHGSGHNIIVLVVVRPGLIVTPDIYSGESTANSFDLSDDTAQVGLLVSAASAENDVRSDLDDALREIGLNTQFSVRVEIGDPSSTFCRVAAEEQVDLIVLSRRIRRLASRVRLGSVTSYVLEHSKCPVLVVQEG